MSRRVLPIICLGVALLAAGCGFLRDLSTPSARLLGHWTTDEQAHLYFSATASGEGTLIVLPYQEDRREYTYEVVKEDEEGDTVTVDITDASGTTERKVFRIPEDGIFMREQSEDVPEEERTDYIFVDTDQKPPAYVETLQAEGKPIS